MEEVLGLSGEVFPGEAVLKFWSHEDNAGVLKSLWEDEAERKKMKSRAPPPPGQPPTASKIHSEQKPPTDVEVIPDQNLVNMKENMINRMVDVTVILPTGEEQRNTVQGSKAVMDLLVDLCSCYHLNPAHHTLELKSWESQQPLNYKPNTLIGVLDLQTVLLKEKVPEGKTKRPPPKVPEKSVRLVVNYLKTQKAVVRVSPEVPLHNIIPAICEKCEVSQEHVVLLRDNITGEELELTKSLDELGIKELYAWDRKRAPPSKTQSEPSLNYRETSRNASVSSDAIEKEKRGFLGFFKVNKRSSKKEEHLRMDSDCGDEDVFSSANERNMDGFSTAPNSPSVMSRSITLGPSQSLGNISGMTANPEIKKRRAPPPPTVTPQLQDTERNGQEKTAAQILQGASSQNDLQKKKRRAPPPPTPTPAMPNRTEEKEDKRKSTVGNGRQVPQKPPRGNTRGPPQLVIPPPPPYPPPDRDIMDPTVCYSEADVTASTKLIPKQSLQLTQEYIYIVDDVVLELSELEETASVSSCFASEDTTDDSGVMSSPSDIVSLDSQNDIMKLRERSANGQVDTAETEIPHAAELYPVRNASCDSKKSGSTHKSYQEEKSTQQQNSLKTKMEKFIIISPQNRRKKTKMDMQRATSNGQQPQFRKQRWNGFRDEMAASKSDNEDDIAARLQPTLVELDDNLGALEAGHYDTDSDSIFNHVNEVLSPRTSNVNTAQVLACSVPVTVIDEVPRVNDFTAPRNKENALLPNEDGIEDFSVDSVNVGNFTNKNNNAGSFDKDHVDSRSLHISKDLIHQKSSEIDFKSLPIGQRRDMFESHVVSLDKRNEKYLGLERIYKNDVRSKECRPKLISSDLKPATESSAEKERPNVFNEKNNLERSQNKIKTELEFRQTSAKNAEEKEDTQSAPMWCQRAHSTYTVTSYEPRVGLTTFKIVPPKPEIKHFDKGTSLSSGAIKIDELGNLVSPNAGDGKNIPDASTSEMEEPFIGRIRAFWRSHSMEKQHDECIEHTSKKTVATTNSKPFTVKPENTPLSPTDVKPVPPETFASRVTKRSFETEKIKQPYATTQSQVKTSIAPVLNRNKTEFPFLKPYRRTSSQYVASAIAKYITSPTFKADSTLSHDKEENNHEERGMKIEAEHSPQKNIIVAKNSPLEETQSIETSKDYSNIFTCNQKASNRFTLGDNFGEENKARNVRALNQATPVGFYKKSVNVPLTKTSVMNNSFAQDDHRLNSKQKTKPVFDQKSEHRDQTNSSSHLRSPGLHVPSFSSGSSLSATKWQVVDKPPGNSLKVSSELNIASANNNGDLEREEKPNGILLGNVNESDITVQTNIFGPKKKFKPVVQKPVLKDTSLHTALMEAIQTGGGKERLQKISDSMMNGSQQKPSHSEPENERSALFAAIRGHSGISGLKKISSAASDELRSFKNADVASQNKENSWAEELSIPPPPPPPVHLSITAAPTFSTTAESNPGEARQALMEAIRSGTGAARLKKVPLLV
ncbi:protein cordon-bleu isoform X2 [Alligator sinensis]|uniref:Protein cordon-bleu isoform X2 n=1 Tax=Alligator sinensis TaxID=38654 RepID=A0A3Q0GUL2_ALLSI|nr:protein cordon-bleu isoform X2 [Alligator sinensis]